LIGFVCAVLAEQFSSLEPSSVRLSFVNPGIGGLRVIRGGVGPQPAFESGVTGPAESAGKRPVRQPSSR